jgi:hypothetical protein
MSNLLNEFLSTGLTSVMPILGNDKTLVYDGDKSFQGIFNEKQLGSELDFGGKIVTLETSFLIPQTLIVASGVTISKDKQCTVDGKTWKIARIIDGSVSTTLMLEDPNATKVPL